MRHDRDNDSVLKPPEADKVPHERTVHAHTVVDNWFYLRDRQLSQTISYLTAENAYTDEVMRPTLELRGQLYAEMVGRIQETDVSAPYRFGDFEYYTRTEQGRQYPILCRKGACAEEILLDCNSLAEGHEYFSLAFDHVSPEGNTLAYAVNTDGSEVFTLRFKDLQTGITLPDEVQGVYYSAAWGSDFYYTTLDAAKRPFRLWRHKIGSAEPDTLIFEEPDARFNVSIHRSRSGRFLFLTIGSHTTTEVHYSAAESGFRLLKPRAQDVEYYVEHQGAWLYIRTNEAAKNFLLMRAPVSDPQVWTEVIPHREDVALEHVDGFENHLVVIERAKGLKRLQVTDTRTGSQHFVAFDEPAYTFFADRNEEYAAASYRFVYSSLVTPRSVYDYGMHTRERELKKRYTVLGGYDPSQYISERIFATAQDGVQVPVSLVYRKGLERHGGNPLYLYGYGAYGIITEPSFAPERISLLERGFVFAIAHIRGSGDMGRRWYDDGKVLNKKNTFSDFIACAGHLVSQGYTSPQLLAIVGGSAGGLLMGAVVNLRPDLFQAVVAHVPFVDVVNTMLDPTLPLTVTEYEEWGNPNVPAFYEYMRSYAPYENVTPQPYPNILVTAGLNDPRVPYWEPAKWVAKLRDLKTDTNIVILKTIMGAGHGGPSGRYERVREKAFEYAFVIDAIAQRSPGQQRAIPKPEAAVSPE